jgi:hypothetical protein
MVPRLLTVVSLFICQQPALGNTLFTHGTSLRIGGVDYYGLAEPAGSGLIYPSVSHDDSSDFSGFVPVTVLDVTHFLQDVDQLRETLESFLELDDVINEAFFKRKTPPQIARVGHPTMYLP